jgi:ABC-type nitrate/sulfonate/bicarbonate transport system ATPase subunit
LSPITLDIDTGAIVAVLGASGVGKTSFLRAVHGDITYTGFCQVSARIWNVLQHDHQLFPWLTVRRNLEMACVLDWQHWAQRWNLMPQLDKKPQYLSVGQRQRLTLLRACCSGAGVLLCDEPLSAVDALNRSQIAADIRHMAQDMQVSVLWVTHDISEAVAVADQFLCITASSTELLHSHLSETQIRETLFA